MIISLLLASLIFSTFGYMVGVKKWMFIFAGYYRESCSEESKKHLARAYIYGIYFGTGAALLAVVSLAIVLTEGLGMVVSFLSLIALVYAALVVKASIRQKHA